MTFIVDASVTIALVIGEEANSVTEAARQRLATGPAWAPSLWWFEVRNVVLMNERRGRLTLERAEGALARLRQQASAIDYEPDEARLLTLARTYRLTVYDAAYVELAERLALPIATLDRGLSAAARAIGVAGIEATD